MGRMGPIEDCYISDGEFVWPSVPIEVGLNTFNSVPDGWTFDCILT